MGGNNIFSLALLFLLFVSSNCIAAAITQKTTGDYSSNIYAPYAKNISINNGLSENDVNILLEQIQANIEVIKFLSEDVKGKKITIEELKARIQELTSTIEILKQPFKDNTSVNQITSFKALTSYEFLDKSVIFHSYIQYKKTLQLLNPDMLIKLLDIYFRSVLLYPSGSQTKYYITAPDGHLMVIQFQGHNEKGEKISISLPDMSTSLLQDICFDFIKSADSKHYELMENLLDRALSSPGLDKNLKINILDLKCCVSKNKLFLNK